LVTFRPDIPYAKAMQLGRAQDDLLLEICADEDAVETTSLEEVRERLRKLS